MLCSFVALLASKSAIAFTVLLVHLRVGHKGHCYQADGARFSPVTIGKAY